MKQPDRFERTVLRRMQRYDRDSYVCAELCTPDVAALLRREHAWVVRMVQRVQEAQVLDPCGAILDRLQERKQ